MAQSTGQKPKTTSKAAKKKTGSETAPRTAKKNAAKSPAAEPERKSKAVAASATGVTADATDTAEHHSAHPSGRCVWSPGGGYRATTRYGEITMFEEGGQRAVDLMLLSAASCLGFFLVEYAVGRKLPVSAIEVDCSGEPAKRPERLSRITTRVKIEGDLSDAQRHRMLTICENACKVMNTLRQTPDCETVLVDAGQPDIV